MKPLFQEYDEGLVTPEQFAEDIEEMMRKLYETYSNTLPCAGCSHVHKITLVTDKPCTRYCEECGEEHIAKEVCECLFVVFVCFWFFEVIKLIFHQLNHQ